MIPAPVSTSPPPLSVSGGWPSRSAMAKLSEKPLRFHSPPRLTVALEEGESAEVPHRRRRTERAGANDEMAGNRRDARAFVRHERAVRDERVAAVSVGRAGAAAELQRARAGFRQAPRSADDAGENVEGSV